MEAVGTEISDCSEIFSLILCHDSLRCILHHNKMMLSGNRHDLIHITADSGIVHRHNYTGSLCNCLLNQIRIYIHRPGINIDKLYLRPAEYKCVCGRYERV